MVHDLKTVEGVCDTIFLYGHIYRICQRGINILEPFGLTKSHAYLLFIYTNHICSKFNLDDWKTVEQV